MYVTRHISKFAAALAALLCLAMVACGGGGGGSQTSNSQSLSMVSLSITPANGSINVGSTQQFTVTGTDSSGNKSDVTSQVTWKVSPANIASITKTGLATGLQGGAANISATLNSLQASTGLTVVGLTSLTINPQGPAINLGDTQQFTATAIFSNGTQQDVTSKAAWTTNPSGIATINSNGLADAIAVGATNVFATFQSTGASTGLNVTSSTHTNLDLTGDYAITVAGSDSNGKWFMAGSIHFNGLGVIPTGTIDFINATGPLTNVAVSGTYNVLKDGRGSLVLTSSNTAFPVHTYHFVLASTKRVLPLAQFDKLGGAATGSLERQTTPFSLAAATYVFRAAGSTPGKAPTATVGLFTIDGNGNVTQGQEDINLANSVNTHTLAASTYTSPSSIGRGTVTLTTASSPSTSYTFAYYMVANFKAYAVEIDGTTLQGGVIELQQGQNFNKTLVVGPFVFLLERAETLSAFGLAGQWVLDGNGTIKSGVQDEDNNGIITADIALNAGSTYTLDVSGNGRGTAVEKTSSGTRNFTFYMVSKLKMYLLRTDNANGVEVGVGETQENPPFNSGSVSGSYGFGFALLDPGLQSSAVGILISDGNGNLSGIEDINDSGSLSSDALNGTYTLANGSTTGRGTNTLTGPSATTQLDFVFYVVSGSKVVSLQNGPVLDGAALLQ